MHRLALALALALVVAAPGAAFADVVVELPAPDPDRGNFWRELIAPHKDELDIIVRHARAAIARADAALYGDYDPTGLERARFYREVLGMLRHARRLAPDDLDVLRLLGRCADELGRTRDSLDALEHALALAGPDRAGPEVTGRLGAIYLRIGRVDDAIRMLRAAQGPPAAGQPLTAHVLVHLSHALAARGQMTEAIDVLASALPPSLAHEYNNELALVAFALAVQYDRDEQRGAAFDVLDRLQASLQGQLAATMQGMLSGIRFAPAEDRHYYQALLYEAAGHYNEARAEWALYAATGNPPFRRRALDHVAAIDRQLRAPPSTTVFHPRVPVRGRSYRVRP